MSLVLSAMNLDLSRDIYSEIKVNLHLLLHDAHQSLHLVHDAHQSLHLVHDALQSLHLVHVYDFCQSSRHFHFL